MVKNNCVKVAFHLLMTLICLMLPACDWFKSEAKAEVNTPYKNLYLIDVNEKMLYENARIAGSLNVQYDDLDELPKKLDKSFDIVFYCTNYACTESDRAARLMRSMGFEKVFVYPGGIQEWYGLSKKDKNGYPIEGPANLKFLSKPIEKFEREETGTISAEELRDLLISRKKNY